MFMNENTTTERPFSEFREEMRYEYPELTPDSVVLDCGGYEGRFAEGINDRYNCYVHVLEPVKEFYERTRDRLKGRENIHVWPFGIGATTQDQVFGIKGDMTGVFANGEFECVQLLWWKACLKWVSPRSLDLMKLNIEGGEFGVLEDMLRHEGVKSVRNIQVQWHDVAPKAAARRNEIIRCLQGTHELTWDFGWVWQNWKIKAEVQS